MRYGLAAGDSLIMGLSLKYRHFGRELFADRNWRGQGRSNDKQRGRRSLGPLLDDQGQSYLYGGAIPGGAVNLEIALQLVDALAHAGDADAEQ